MESLLEPFVHYIPLDDDLSNLDEMVQYCIDNDNECEKISERATLWMYDFMFSSQSKLDEEEIKRRIVAEL